MPQFKAAAQSGYIDIDRVAVSGQSYGGYSTAVITCQTNLFRASIPVKRTYDLGAGYARMQGEHAGMICWAETGQGRMGDSPWANPLRYLDNSSYDRPDRIHTPLLNVMVEDDATTNIDARKLLAGLRRRERPVQQHVYRAEAM